MNKAQNPAPAVPAAMVQTRAPTAGGISGATRDANIAVCSVVSGHTAALVVLPPPSALEPAEEVASSAMTP